MESGYRVPTSICRRSSWISDVTMQRTAARSFAAEQYVVPGLRRSYPEHRFLDEFPIGEAVLILPFFAVGHAIAIVAGAEQEWVLVAVPGSPRCGRRPSRTRSSASCCSRRC